MESAAGQWQVALSAEAGHTVPRVVLEAGEDLSAGLVMSADYAQRSGFQERAAAINSSVYKHRKLERTPRPQILTQSKVKKESCET